MRSKANNRRISSILRDNLVHEIYREECQKLGEAGSYVSREYLYNKVKERTGLSIRSISYIINHTRPTKIEGGWSDSYHPPEMLIPVGV